MECYNVMIGMHVVGGSYLALLNGITMLLISENIIILGAISENMPLPIWVSHVLKSNTIVKPKRQHTKK
jgi:hypothetical protein